MKKLKSIFVIGFDIMRQITRFDNLIYPIKGTTTTDTKLIID